MPVKRFIQALLRGLQLAAIPLLAATWAPPPIPAPSGPCIEIAIISNGWHTDLLVPADIFPPAHPLRRTFPKASHLLIGAGERDFYQSNADPALLLPALIPPSPMVMHVGPLAGPAEAYFPAPRVVPAAISAQGAADLVAYIDAELIRDETGDLIPLGSGYWPPAQFFAAKGDFHLFNMCNHWTARALSAAGMPIGARFTLMANQVTGQIANAERCPPAQS